MKKLSLHDISAQGLRYEYWERDLFVWVNVRDIPVREFANQEKYNEWNIRTGAITGIPEINVETMAGRYRETLELMREWLDCFDGDPIPRGWPWKNETPMEPKDLIEEALSI